jgi:hypothetical protein
MQPHLTTHPPNQPNPNKHTAAGSPTHQFTLLIPPPTHTHLHSPCDRKFWKLRSIVSGVDVTCGGAAHIARRAVPPITALELEGPGFALDMPDGAMYVRA